MKNKYRKLDKIYDTIPSLECKGFCHDSCTVIPTSKIETTRAIERLGYDPFNIEFNKPVTKVSDIPRCGALKNNRCTMYDIRPAICRVYGVAQGLDCGFGCKPKQIMSRDKAHEIFRKIEEL